MLTRIVLILIAFTYANTSKCFSQSALKEEPMVISGNISGTDLRELSLNIFEQGCLGFKEENISVDVSEEGNFHVEINSYLFAKIRIATENIYKLAYIYFIPGDKLEMKIEINEELEEYKVDFYGESAAFQNYFIVFEKEFPSDDEYYKHFYYSYDYDKCKKYFNFRKKEQLEFCKNYFSENNLSSKLCNEAKDNIIYKWGYDRIYYYIFHYYWHPDNKPIVPDGKDFEFIDDLNLDNPKNENSYFYLDCMKWYSKLIRLKIRDDLGGFYGKDIENKALFEYIKTKHNGLGKDIALAMNLSDDIENMMKPEELDTLKKYVDMFESIVENRVYFDKITTLYNYRKKLQPGQFAFNFKLNDLYGNPVSLSDFKGKIVYLDIWRTNCGPCLQEIPHAQKLHKEFENDKGIVFLCISTDIDIERLKKFIITKEIPGVHLIADAKQAAELSKKFMFQGEPHYILIDKKGNFINANMTRPSNEKTKQILLKALGR
ncbi:MAG: TlpA disulfide reductase family protein [bacterium]